MVLGCVVGCQGLNQKMYDRNVSMMTRRLASGPADDRLISDLIIDQVEFSSLLLLNKCDLVAPVRGLAFCKAASLQYCQQILMKQAAEA